MISTAASHQGAIEMIWLLLLGSCHIGCFHIQSMDVSNKKLKSLSKSISKKFCFYSTNLLSKQNCCVDFWQQKHFRCDQAKSMF